MWSQGLFSSWSTRNSLLICALSLWAMGKKNSFAQPSENFVRLWCSFAAKETAVNCMLQGCCTPSWPMGSGVLSQVGKSYHYLCFFCYCSTAWTLGTSPSRRKRTAEGKTKYGGTEKYLQNPGDPSGNSPNTGIERSFQAETNYSEGSHTSA